MKRIAWVLALGLSLAGCQTHGQPVSSRAQLVFLTRDACMNTDKMRANLDVALQTLHRPIDYQVIDEATLPGTDPRSAYPTPTVLYANRDLFGMSEPTPPFPEPT